jgi:hypothetical protein
MRKPRRNADIISVTWLTTLWGRGGGARPWELGTLIYEGVDPSGRAV